MTDTIVGLTLRLEPKSVQLRVGASASVVVTIANASDTVEHYEVRVQGLREGCEVSADPELCKLNPNEVGQVRLTLTADEVRPPPAGSVTAGVTVRSHYRQGVTRTAEMGFEVLRAPGMRLAVSPEVVSGGDRTVTVDVSNTGNTPLDVHLGGEDAERKLTLIHEPPRLLLDLRERGQSHVYLRGRRPLSGVEVRRAVTVNASSEAGQQDAKITFVQRPWVPGGLTRLVAAATGLAVMVAAVITSAVLVAGKIGALPGLGKSSATSGAGGSPSGGPTSASSSTSPGSPSPVAIDVSKPPPGGASEMVLGRNQYAGLDLSAIPNPDEAGCTKVTTAAFLTPADKRGAVSPGGIDQAAGTGTCNDLALRIGLAQPATSVTVAFIGRVAASAGTAGPTSDSTPGSSSSGPPAAAPTLIAYNLADASNASTVVAATVGNGQASSLVLQAANGGKLTAVIFAPYPVGEGVIPAVTSVTYTPAVATP